MAGVKYIDYDGIPIEITKKKMKNMYIRVDKDTGIVRVSIPNHVTYSEAEAFVERNLEWIEKTREDVLNKNNTKPVEYVNGETIKLWGDEYELEFVPSYCDKGVYIKDSKVVILAPLDSSVEFRQSLVNKWLREELWDKIEEYKMHCCEVVGKFPKEWHIRDMKTKWGTCNYRDKRIWLSLGLVHKNPICLEYVMYHELTHLYVPNHGPDFKAYMDRFCPEWRKIRRMLNE